MEWVRTVYYSIYSKNLKTVTAQLLQKTHNWSKKKEEGTIAHAPFIQIFLNILFKNSMNKKKKKKNQFF